jgi:hypothetical protein
MSRGPATTPLVPKEAAGVDDEELQPAPPTAPASARRSEGKENRAKTCTDTDADMGSLQEYDSA